MHLRPHRGLWAFKLLAGADDVGLGEPGEEHRDVALSDLVLTAEAGKAGHEFVAVLERHAERAPGLEFARLHLRASAPFAVVAYVQFWHFICCCDSLPDLQFA